MSIWKYYCNNSVLFPFTIFLNNRFSTYGGGVVPHDFPPPVSFRYSRKEQCLGLHACDKISYETNDEPFPALQTDHGCTSNATYPRNDLILFKN